MKKARHYCAVISSILLSAALLFSFSVHTYGSSQDDETVASDGHILATYEVTWDTLKLRSEPLMSADVIKEINTGEQVNVLDFSCGGFWLVSYEGVEGYALPTYLSGVGDALMPEAAKSVYLTGDLSTVILRATPQKTGAHLAEVPVNEKADLLDTTENGFVLISYGGTPGYVQDVNVSDEEMNNGALLMAKGRTYFFGLTENGYEADKAANTFKLAAKAGEADAYAYLGLLSERTSAPDRFEKALEYYDTAIEAGSSLGKVLKGELYKKGNGVERDYTEAKRLYEEAADEGFIGANTYIGRLYADGLGVQKNGTNALKYYNKALQSPDYYMLNNARYAISVLYFNGSQGVDADYEKYLLWSQAAANEGYRDGIFGLAKSYDIGRGTAQDSAKALELYEEAGKAGHAISWNYAGVHYSRGKGVAADPAKALECYLRSAEMGCVSAMYNAGSIIARNSDATEEELKTAFEYVRQAAEVSSTYKPWALLGWMYYGGIGTEADLEEAEKWLDKTREAAEEAGDQDELDWLDDFIW